MENTKYSDDSNKTYGWWLETPRSDHSNNVYNVYANWRKISDGNAFYVEGTGVRPAIEVKKINISY